VPPTGEFQAADAVAVVAVVACTVVGGKSAPPLRGRGRWAQFK
jgi:hypothetical protein